MAPGKILAIKFKYLGDVVIATPALYALHQKFPQHELHVLVAQEAVALLQHIPWITRVWGLDKSNRAASRQTIRQLRREKFSYSLDFVGNDRGALCSLFIRARQRLGIITQLGFFGRKFCYNRRIPEAALGAQESLRDFALLKSLGITPPEQLQLYIATNEKLASYAQEQLAGRSTLCHLTTSKPKKEWPVERWRELFQLIPNATDTLAFTTGPSPREQQFLDQLQAAIPQAHIVRNIPSLDHFTAIVQATNNIICNDSLVSHLGAALQKKTITLYGPSSIQQWHPLSPHSHWLWAGPCHCYGHDHECRYNQCLGRIRAQDVFTLWQKHLATSPALQP